MVALVALVCAAVPSAVAAFSAPVDLSAAGNEARYPAVASDLDGDAFAVWTRNNAEGVPRVQARWIEPYGNLGKVATLSASGYAYNPEIAMADNVATAVWSGMKGSRHARFRPPRASWDRSRPSSPPARRAIAPRSR